MISPDEELFVPFLSDEEELAFLLKAGLVSAKTAKVKPFYYNGAYTRFPQFCRVVGSCGGSTAVIAPDGGLHCINADRLSEMQTGAAKLLKELTEINAVSSFVAFDFETTGLRPDSDRIIEIGAVKYIDGEEVSSFETLVNPIRLLSAQITELTGITNLQLKDAPTLDTVLPELLEFVGDLPLVAHNAPFDSAFLEAACKRWGLDAPKEYYDTLVLSRKILPGFAHYKLQDLIFQLNIDGGEAHRASSDARACGELFNICRTVPFASNGGRAF
jgi:DNA polymerase-3 subunit epsilon